MTIIIKAIVIILLGFIFFSLGSALYFLMRDRENSERIVKALTWRIGLSLLLFVILIFAYAMGWLVPHQIS
ncbi:twin transmembrane helix small protein [Aquicella siphonis]|uniref:twin transmembrane helix small protein n=1 Tax=Aquicella siphonis TaxID=254247 RepID=UPI0011DD829E|nr:twin transmembrane helix small protein [Aquicella siphonis]